jgi:hypothetical protein
VHVSEIEDCDYMDASCKFKVGGSRILRVNKGVAAFSICRATISSR